MFATLGQPTEAEQEAQETPPPGRTVLDRVHQAILLHADGRSAALQRFLEESARDERFFRLANALSALYPASLDEKRWVDGVLGRMKSLGLVA